MANEDTKCVARYRANNAEEIAAEIRGWRKMPWEMRYHRYTEAGRKLALDMLSLSVYDLLTTLKTAKQKKWITADKMESARLAWEWFAERRTEFGGYGWALTVTNINPNVVRGVIGRESPDHMVERLNIMVRDPCVKT